MPTTDGYGQGIDIAALTDAPNAEKLAQDIVNGLTPRSIMRFQSASERGATLTAPAAGMMAWLETERLLTAYDGAQWAVVAAGTQAWTTLPLRTGYTHNGNSNGTAAYRVVNLFGEPTVMLRGGVNLTYDAGNPVNSGYFLSTLLPANARPGTLRTVSAACSVVSSSVTTVKIDAEPDGNLRFVIPNGSEPPWVSLNGLFYSL